MLLKTNKNIEIYWDTKTPKKICRARENISLDTQKINLVGNQGKLSMKTRNFQKHSKWCINLF